MHVWKQTAASILLVLGVFNDFVSGLAAFGKQFRNSAEDDLIESEILRRKAIKDMAAKHEMTESDLDKIRDQIRNPS